jgi:hypothetical protein
MKFGVGIPLSCHLASRGFVFPGTTVVATLGVVFPVPSRMASRDSALLYTFVVWSLCGDDMSLPLEVDFPESWNMSPRDLSAHDSKSSVGIKMIGVMCPNYGHCGAYCSSPDDVSVCRATVEIYWQRKNRRTRRKSGPNASLSAAKPTWTENGREPRSPRWVACHWYVRIC